MKERIASGSASFVLGILSLLFAICARHSQAVHGAGDAVLLNWLDRMGFVREANHSVAKVEPSSLPPINDETAIVLMISTAAALAVFAIILVFIAEFRKEPTLYLSGGFICGAMAITVLDMTAGLLVLIFGVVGVQLVRKARRVP